MLLVEDNMRTSWNKIKIERYDWSDNCNIFILTFAVIWAETVIRTL